MRYKALKGKAPYKFPSPAETFLSLFPFLDPFFSRVFSLRPEPFEVKTGFVDFRNLVDEYVFSFYLYSMEPPG